MHTGSCLCRSITFEVTGDIPAPTACHCSKCRKLTGHFEAGSDIPRSQVKIEGLDRVTWYQTNEKVRRGFCSTCGSQLFFDPVLRDWIGIAMGAFDRPTNTKLSMHIFVADKGDYYEIGDGLPQNQQ